MRLQTRLTIAVTLIIAFVALAIGAFAITQSERAEMHRIDSVLNADALALESTTDDPLMLAQLLADQSPIPVSVVYVDADGGMSQLADSAGELTTLPASDAIASSQSEPVTIDDPAHVRLRTLALPDQDYLLTYSALDTVAESKSSQVRLLIMFTLVTMLLGIGITFVFFRRDSELSHLVLALQVNQSRMQQFIGDASHELRTPLTVIKGYTELLSTGRVDNPAKAATYYSRMTNEISRMETIVKDLLLISELIESRPPMTDTVDLSALVHHCVEDLQALQTRRTVQARVVDDLCIEGSQQLIERLVSNIFSNVRRHTPDDSAVVVTLQEVRGMAVLQVSDAGPGLPDTAYADGMQYFQRFDQSRSRDSGGSGLGMSICSGIAQAHNGTIDLAKSDLGGLNVTVRLPMGQAGPRA